MACEALLVCLVVAYVIGTLALNVWPHCILGSIALLCLAPLAFARGLPAAPRPCVPARGTCANVAPCCATAAVLLIVASASVLALWASYGGYPAFGTVVLATSPRDRSTCSRAPHQRTTPYNAGGFFSFGAPGEPTTPEEVAIALKGFVLPCFVPGLRWGDNNGRSIVGYAREAPDSCYPDLATPCGETPDCATIATDRPIDYPNPTIGLRDGLVPGAPDGAGCLSNTLDSLVCPGVANILNPIGLLGTGGYPCALCLADARRRGIVPSPDPTLAWCPVSLYEGVADGLCFVCPGAIPGDPTDPEVVTRAAEFAIVVAPCVVAVALFAWCAGCSSPDEEERDAAKAD